MKKLIPILGIAGVVLFLFIIVIKVAKNDTPELKKMEGSVISTNATEMVFKASDDLIYTMGLDDNDIAVGDQVVLEYTGVFDKRKAIQDVKVVNAIKADAKVDYSKLDDKGLFSKFYKQAYAKLNTLSLDEKIGQLILARYPGSNDGNKYNLAGYVFYEKDFKDRDANGVLAMMQEASKGSKIPLLTAVDEEGGNVVRVSSNPKLASTRFLSPKELYDQGGMELIRSDTVNKSKLLESLGLNVNLAPVVDVATNTNSYIYPRTIGYGVDITSQYAKNVIEASKDSRVSYTLKHFPGYGDNTDTHSNKAIDDTPYDEIISKNVLPFKSGIDVGAEAVLVGHTEFTNIEAVPATLSKAVHNILRSDLGFSGVIITDDLDMGATKDISNRYVGSLLAGNNLLIVTDYEDAFNEIKTGVRDGNISEEYINELTFKVLAWKYYKLLLMENNK